MDFFERMASAPAARRCLRLEADYNSRRLRPFLGEKLQVPVMEILQGMRDMLHEKKTKGKAEEAVISIQ
jgi:hypothetical protein